MNTLSRRLVVAGALVAASVGLAVAPAGAGTQPTPDASFTLEISKAITGTTAEVGTFDIVVACSSSGPGEQSLIGLDTTDVAEFEESVSHTYTLGAGDTESIDVYVEFSRDTVISCTATEVGGTGTEPTSTTLGCTDEGLVVCSQPMGGQVLPIDHGTVYVTWADIQDGPGFPAGDVGSAALAFTNDYTAPPTTPTTAPATSAPAAQAAAATPRFTG